MSKIKNRVWSFFSSVKLALITLVVLASVSIIGTIVKQRQATAHYVEEYGAAIAQVLESTGLANMYGSWWFISLLSLFAINLLVCSIERFPTAWRMVTHDNLSTEPSQLEKMGSVHRACSNMPPGACSDRVQQILADAGWPAPRRKTQSPSILLFTQKGAWSRLGVYFVHLSILIIMAGAVIGNLFGFKAYVFLPEGRSTKNVFLQRSAESIPLGFELQCDRFTRSFYPNGMIREFRSDLTVFDRNLEEPYHKSIIVNDPLTHRGISFYQADSFPLEEYFVFIRDQANGIGQAFRVPAERDVSWEGTPVAFRIEEFTFNQEGEVRRAKIRLTDDGHASSVIWVDNEGTATINNFTISFRQLYSTLLLANKDPGVWLVYFGCFVMVLGLATSFFFSHKRIWVQITPEGKSSSQILISGTSNKQKPVFEQHFAKLVSLISRDTAVIDGKKKR